MTDEMVLEVPVDAAYAVTARLFVVTAARDLGLPDPTVEDLRLAASELVANAVESNGTGPIRLALVTDGSDVVLDASGVGPLRNDPPISRLALLETLFDAGNMLQGERLRIRVPMTDATGSRSGVTGSTSG